MERRERRDAISWSNDSAGERGSGPRHVAACSLLLALLLAAWAPPAGARSGAPQAAPSPGSPPAAPEAPLPPPECKAASAILVDASTGTVLWEKDAHARRPIASTTKILTAALVLESGRLDDQVAFSEHARHTDYANLNAKPGEKFSMRDLLYAILLRSSNDACVAVAEHLAGSTWRFAQQMNTRARELGCRESNFVTPNGLYDPEHYSSAADLATLARHAIGNPIFNKIVATRSYTLSRPLNPRDILIKNHNKFLAHYQGADGIKTGYIRQSGKCLVASATRAEEGSPWRLLTVVLNSPDMYGDSARLMDWGRKCFQPVFFARRGEQLALASVRHGERPQVPLVAADDLFAIVRRYPGKNPEREVRVQQGIAAPVRRAQVGGKLLAMVNGRPVAQVDLVAASPVTQVWTAEIAPYTGWGIILGALLLGPAYVRAFAKGAFRRRGRLQERRGAPDQQRESLG